jgi:tRNA G10  N-methylase Trm11
LTGIEPHLATASRPNPIGQRLLADALDAGALQQDLLVGYAPEDISPLLERAGMIAAVRIQNDRSSSLFQTKHTHLEGTAWLSNVGSGSRLSPSSRTKNEYLSHAFHKYKAKFFPRMARALVNFTTPVSGLVLDPFVGSGTLTVEAELMGIPSIGLDIDPLSILISQAKSDALSMPLDTLDKAIAHFVQETNLDGGSKKFSSDRVISDRFLLPSFIRCKIQDPHQRHEIEYETKIVRSIIDSCGDETSRQWLRLTLSHAIATKISLRWMGTGDNRFSLSIAKRSLLGIIFAQLTKMRNALERRGDLVKLAAIDPERFVKAQLCVGDVRDLPLPSASIDSVVTSPPYLPASSGRETYLRSRACSLVALDLMSSEEILRRERQMIGSILRASEPRSLGLPAQVTELVEWMLPQRARKPKALATAAYFLDLRKALQEISRVLRPGGKLALVLSAKHTFYDLITRNVVRTVNMPEVIAELLDEPSNEIALKITRVLLIQLGKMDYAARPGSSGDYSEAIILAERI